ncbi:hypothetical protein L9F63_017547, partial [Diploptera punctata]
VKISEPKYHYQLANKIRICTEMERRLRYFEMEIMKEDDIEIYEPEENYEALKPQNMSDLASVLSDMENELLYLSDKYKALLGTNLDLLQMEEIIYKTDDSFDNNKADINTRASIMRSSGTLEKSASREEFIRKFREETGMKLGNSHYEFVAGVIPQKNVYNFEVMLYRVGRGNLFYKMKPIETPFDDPKSPVPVFKTVFLIYFHGDELKNRVNKICNGFNVTLYNCPETLEERLLLKNNISNRKKEVRIGLDETSALRRRLLVACAMKLRMWQMMVIKMKCVYYVLNGLDMDTSSTYVVAECWIPLSHLDLVCRTLEKTNEHARGSTYPTVTKIHTTDEPPTYNRTNKYTRVIQQLVDSYGYAKYGEVNPAPFTMITFPFLFAVMFGDVGHGMIMFFAGTMFIFYEKRIRWHKMGEIMNIFFEGRYLIMLMGLFSMYAGLMYNECFSLSISLFTSGWKINMSQQIIMQIEHIDLNPQHDFKSPYPFGMDPVWRLSENLLTVSNSLKMKLSIVFGVIHMLFGIFLGLWNFLYFRQMDSIIGEFLPHVLFLCSIFLYMVFLIFFKWTMYGPHAAASRKMECAPSILSTMILMAMLQKPKANQPHLCKILVYLQKRRRMLSKRSSVISRSTTVSQVSVEDFSGSIKFTEDEREIQRLEVEDSLGELFIHQGIHTIEFVLGCVSHTASYLRLWALSLAHAELSDVLWKMVMRAGLTVRWPLGCLGAFTAFGIWAFLTFAVMVVMEGLSAFLHTLRLHWVEFQSKFYSGLGHGFVPFSFKTILKK